MKILFDGSLFEWQFVGGMVRYFREIVRRISKKEDASVFLYRKKKKPFYFEDYGDARIIDSFPFIKSGNGYKLIRKYNAMIDILNRFHLKLSMFDIYHPTFINFPPIQIPMVVTVHDLVYEKFPELYSNQEDFVKRRAKNFTTASHVICVSESTRRDLIEFYGLAPEKITVIYHGAPSVDLRIDGAIDIFTHTSRKSLYSRPFIIYVGAFWPHKNFTRFLEAFSRWTYLDEVLLVCVGGDQRWSKNHEDAINRLGLSDRIQILGYVNDQMLYSLYSRAHFLVYPSLYEGFGLPVLESMACGGIVVLSNTASLPEVAGNCGIYFDPYDVESIRDAMTRAIELSNEERECIVERGLKRVKLFSWEKAARETHEVYKRVLHSRDRKLCGKDGIA